MAGSGVADILCPKPAVYTRDHAAENRRALRELEAAAVSRRHATEAAVAAAAEPAAPTRGKFQHVESKLASAGLGRKQSPVKSRAPGGGSPGSQGDVGAPAGKPFLRAKSREATAPLAPVLAPFVRAVVERKAAVPKIAELRRPATAPSTSPSKNFIAENMAAVPIFAAISKPAPRVDPSAPVPKYADYGVVPEYLEERKARWAVEDEAKRKAAEIAAACPPGHRMMPEEERVATLELVTSSLAEAKAMLLAMPLRIEIPSALRRKADLEAKVSKLEAAVTTFSRPRIFVKND